MPTGDVWTPALLKEYVDQRFESQDRAVLAALASQDRLTLQQIQATEKAIEKSERAYDTRFGLLNELRSMVTDQQRTLIPRTEANIEFGSIREKIDTLDGKIDSLAKLIDRSEGRGSGIGSAWGWLLGGVGLIGGLVSLFFALK